MPKYVPDAELKQSLAEPIEFELKGRMFKLDVVTQKILNDISNAEKQGDQSENERIIQVLVGEAEYAQLGQLDVRETNAFLRWFGSLLRQGLGEPEKNEDGK